jgi:hypothetical protein
MKTPQAKPSWMSGLKITLSGRQQKVDGRVRKAANLPDKEALQISSRAIAQKMLKPDKSIATSR